MIYKIQGQINFLYEIEKFGKSGRIKQRFVLTVGNPIEPNRVEHVVFDCMDEDIKLLNEAEVGSTVEVDFYLCGRKFVGDSNQDAPAVYINIVAIALKIL